MRTFVALLTLFAIGRAVAAESYDPSRSPALHPGEMLRVIDSAPNLEGTQLEIFASPRTEAVRLYAEPSHTLLGAYVELTYSSTPAGRAFRKRVSREVRSENIAIGDRIGILAIRYPRKLTDKRIAAFATRVWPDGKHEERQVLDASLPAGLASFTAVVFEPKTDDLLVACSSPCGTSHGRYRRGETFDCCPNAR